MKKTVKKVELPDIPGWVNAAYYEKQKQKEKLCMPKIEHVEFQEKTECIWNKKIFWAVAIVGAVIAGFYIGQNTPPFAPKAVRPATYVVQPKDTLWDISQHLYGESRNKQEASWQIIEDNNLDNNGTIVPGMVLKIR